MRRLPNVIGAMLLLAILIVPIGVHGQESVKIESLEVSLWPEYDRPAVLVIYRLRLASETTLPASVGVPIPAEVGEPHAVAVRGAEGTLLVAPYERQVSGDWATITLEAASTAIQVEYYADLAQTGEDRSYTFTWPGTVELGDFTFEVQAPAGASDMQIDPPTAEPTIGGDGLTYYLGSLGPQEASASVTISIGYRKTIPGLTAELLQTPTSLGRPEITQGGTPDVKDILPWLVSGLALVLLAVGAYLYLRLVRERGRLASRTRRHRPSRTPGEGEKTLDVASVFCHYCGTKADVGDRYCRDCGRQLRR